MKVISAYAIATGISAPQIQASGALMGLILLLIGASGAITVVGRYIPIPVIRGVQLSTGILLTAQGVRMMLGNSRFQIISGAAEPYLKMQALGFIPIGVIIGLVLAFLTLLLLDNRKIPAAFIIVITGLIIGGIFGTHEGLNELKIGLNIPHILPWGFPSRSDFLSAFIILAIPQLPMTLGNAVLANSDLAKQYFGKSASRVTNRALCISMALGNIGSFLLGGMPMCHGAGGLASRYRFGARTAGSNIIIGLIFVILAIFLGEHFLSIYILYHCQPLVYCLYLQAAS